MIRSVMYESSKASEERLASKDRLIILMVASFVSIELFPLVLIYFNVALVLLVYGHVIYMLMTPIILIGCWLLNVMIFEPLR